MVKLMIVSVRSSDKLGKIVQILRDSDKDVLITDRETLNMLVGEKIVGKNFKGSLYLFNFSSPEEDSLKLFTMSKPSEVFICDEAGKLEAFSRFVKLVPGLKISVC
ncbi:MAG: hypothetical protein ACPLSM_06405 [Thermosphaera sp.]